MALTGIERSHRFFLSKFHCSSTSVDATGCRLNRGETPKRICYIEDNDGEYNIRILNIEYRTEQPKLICYIEEDDVDGEYQIRILHGTTKTDLLALAM